MFLFDRGDAAIFATLPSSFYSISMEKITDSADNL